MRETNPGSSPGPPRFPADPRPQHILQTVFFLLIIFFCVHFPYGLICPHARIGRERRAWRPVTGKDAAALSPGPASSHRAPERVPRAVHSEAARQRAQTTWAHLSESFIPCQPARSSPLCVFVGKPTLRHGRQARVSRDGPARGVPSGTKNPTNESRAVARYSCLTEEHLGRRWGGVAALVGRKYTGRRPRTRISLVDERDPRATFRGTGRSPGAAFSISNSRVFSKPSGKAHPPPHPIVLFSPLPRLPRLYSPCPQPP